MISSGFHGRSQHSTSGTLSPNSFGVPCFAPLQPWFTLPSPPGLVSLVLSRESPPVSMTLKVFCLRESDLDGGMSFNRWLAPQKSESLIHMGHSICMENSDECILQK
jgi:hypothetical protein